MTARLDTMQAAVLLAKLGIFDEELTLRQKAADRYADKLAGCGVMIRNCLRQRPLAGHNM